MLAGYAFVLVRKCNHISGCRDCVFHGGNDLRACKGLENHVKSKISLNEYVDFGLFLGIIMLKIVVKNITIIVMF